MKCDFFVSFYICLSGLLVVFFEVLFIFVSLLDHILKDII